MTTKIEWTDETWNPVTGCTKVSDGCKHCYAERDWKRLSANPKTSYYGRKFTDVQCHPERLDQPLRWTKPRMIFVNSMSDLFHEDVPFNFIDDIFDIIDRCPHHVFQVLTKRPERMYEWADSTGNRLEVLGKCANVWLGVSVENQQTAAERIPLLLQTPAAIRWLSIEPMLGPINLRNISYSPWAHCSLTGGIWDPSTSQSRKPTSKGNSIDWVVLGGESGPKARPMHPDWVRSIRDQCLAAGVPFFFKQWGQWVSEVPAHYGEPNAWLCNDGRFTTDENTAIDAGGSWKGIYRINKKEAGRTLDGRTWEEYPHV